MQKFDPIRAQKRCLRYRQRILDISQKVGALHAAPAFSCLETVDIVYNDLLRRNTDGCFSDLFLMSKGHGCMSQYVVLEDLNILSNSDLELYNKPEGRLGAHPDYGTPGIQASTGSLGHGLGIAAGMAYAEKLVRKDARIYCLVGDGEMQEGSIWEAIMMAANLKLNNLIVFVDFNNYQGLEKTTDTHPFFMPLGEKIRSFGWETAEVNGHTADEIYSAVTNREGNKPLLIICHTIKGKGVAYMENVPIWHYRAPNKEEYEIAIRDLRPVVS